MPEEQSLFVCSRHPDDLSPTAGRTSTGDTSSSIYSGNKRKSAGGYYRSDRTSSDPTSETSTIIHPNLLDSGTAFQFAAASSSDHIEPPQLSYTSAAATSTIAKGESSYAAILRSWPDEIRMPMTFGAENDECKSPLPAFPEGARFLETSLQLFPLPLSQFIRMPEILTTIPWRTEPPIFVFGAWVCPDIPATKGIPESIRESTTASALMDCSGITSDTSALVYLPRLAILKDGGNKGIECCASGIALYMAKVSDVASMLRSCLRIAACWGHIGIILDFASLLKSLCTFRFAETEECRSELANALVEVFQEAEFLGRWKFVTLLSPDWEDSRVIEERGLDGLTV